MSTQSPTTTEKKKDIRALIQSEGVKAQIAMVLPKHLTADQWRVWLARPFSRLPNSRIARPSHCFKLMLCSQADRAGRSKRTDPVRNQVQVIFDYRGLVALPNAGVECIYAIRLRK
jgi:hypothetical protein